MANSVSLVISLTAVFDPLPGRISDRVEIVILTPVIGRGQHRDVGLVDRHRTFHTIGRPGNPLQAVGLPLDPTRSLYSASWSAWRVPGTRRSSPARRFSAALRSGPSSNVEVQSTPGRGTTFKVLLPRANG